MGPVGLFVLCSHAQTLVWPSLKPSRATAKKAAGPPQKPSRAGPPKNPASRPAGPPQNLNPAGPPQNLNPAGPPRNLAGPSHIPRAVKSALTRVHFAAVRVFRRRRGVELSSPKIKSLFQTGVSGARGYQCRTSFIGNSYCARFQWFKKMTPQEYRRFFGGGATRKRTSQETPLQTRQDTRRNPRHKRCL